MYNAYLVSILIIGLCQGKPQNNSPISSKIVGGSSAVAGQFPYQVSLRTSDLNHICGGTIIDKNWIVTAAHCIKGTNIYYVIAGTIYLTTGGVRLGVAKRIQHPNYSETNGFKNDIALIKTKQSLNYSTNIKPLKLPTFNIGGGYRMIVSGWGAFLLSNLGMVPDNLQYLEVNSLTNTECKKKLVIEKTHLCTYRNVGQGICYGDSGGPLMYSNELHGVAAFVVYSTGTSRCAAGYPDGLTRVYEFNEWIRSTISNK